MPLPADAFSYRFARGRVHPRWLGERDVDFVVSVLATIAMFDGLTVGEADLVADAQLPNRIAAGIWLLERRRWAAEVDAPVAPEAVRSLVFELAAVESQVDALERAAEILSGAPEVLRGALFADRTSRRRWRAAEPSAAGDVIARYNLAVVQTLLARSMEVDIVCRGDPRPIVRAAKRDGLIAYVEPVDEGVRVVLAGPLALFHDTAKYGRSIARFVPSLVSSPKWSLRARVLVGAHTTELRLSDDDAVSFAGPLTAASAPIARRAVSSLRKSGVRVELAPPVLRTGARLVVPDFALEWGDRRVYVDVVPFATAEHLAAKLELVAQLDVPLLVCVEEHSIGQAVSPVLVPYRRAIDPSVLLAAARSAVKDDAA